MNHVVRVKRKGGGTVVYLDTADGPCPGNLAVGMYESHKVAEMAAYHLAKQVGATGLEGVSEHVQGHWLLWQGSHA